MSSSTVYSHVPVLLDEVVSALSVQPGGRYIDATTGGGGHAAAILKASMPGGQLLGLDADPEAIEVASARLREYRDSFLLVNQNFVNLQAVCIKKDFFPVHGILFDLGLSSLQLEDSIRGFSFQHDAPLDMRFSPAQEVTAADIVNDYSEAELDLLIRDYGEERFSRSIARDIVRQRPLKTTQELVRVIEKATGGRKERIHPATRTFQALRIAVNGELKNLELALKQAIYLLGFGGRLVVISYHSLEDRIVKQFMRQEASDCICPPNTPACVCHHRARLRIVDRLIRPSEAEIGRNPRSRSARMRVAERIIPQENGPDITEIETFLSSSGARAWRSPALLRKLKMVFSVS